MTMVRAAQIGDLETVLSYDKHVSEDILCSKIQNGTVLIAEKDGRFVGWLRYCLFWDEIPFMNMLYVLEEHRNRGIGTLLVRTWEELMLASGFDKVMTSTLEQESAQHFYRKLGYLDLGKFMPFADEYELILGKEIGEKSV